MSTRLEAEKNLGYVEWFWGGLWLFLGLEPARVTLFPESTFVASVGTTILGFGLSYLLFLVILRFRAGRFPPPRDRIVKWTIAYWGVAALSMLISPWLRVQGGPFQPLFFFFYDAIWFVAVYLLVALARDRVRLLQQMVAGFVIGTVILVAGLFLLTDALQQFAETGRLRTDLLASTTYAPRTGAAILMLVAAPKRGRIFKGSLRWGLIVLFTVTTIFAFGKTVLVATTLGLFAWWWTQEGTRKLQTGAALALGITGVLVIFGDELYARAKAYIQEPNNLATLTGRTVLWKTVIEMGIDQPVLGYGYGLMDRYIWDYIPPIGWKERDVLAQAHNAVLDVFVKMGGVGLLVFIGLIGTGVRRIGAVVRGTSSDGVVGQAARLALAVVLLFLIRSLAEGALNGGFDLLVFFALVLLVGQIECPPED